MKSCPSCHRTYQDETMLFCLEDGTALVRVKESSADPDATFVLPTQRSSSSDPESTWVDEPGGAHVDPRLSRSPGFPVGDRSRRSPLPWILGIVIVLGISALGVAFIVTRALSGERLRGSQVSEVTPSPTPAEINTAASPLSTPPYSTDSPRPAVAGSSPGSTPANSVEAPATSTPKSTATASSHRESEPKPSQPRSAISGGVLNGKAIRLVQPAYPPLARTAHASGTVVVQVLIDEDGNVVSAHATSGHPLLQAAAVAAARASRFSPTKLSGQPVKVTGVVTYNFVAQ